MPTTPRPSRRTPTRSGLALLAVAALAAPLLGTTPGVAAEPQPEITPITHSADGARLALATLGVHSSGVYDASAAEIVRFHAASRRVFVVNAQSGAVDVLDASDPRTPTRIATLDTADVDGLPAGAAVNSVDVRPDGLLVAAVEAPEKTDPGWLAFADASTATWLGAVRIGAQPDMVGFTPDGDRAVVAIEAEPADDYGVDPEGGIGVVAVPATVAAPAQGDVRIADFHAFEDGGARTLPDGVRIFGPTVNEEFPVSANLEPEYVAFSADGTTAYAALQENNAVAVVDLAAAEVTEIWPLGTADHSLPGRGIDASDRDDAIRIEPRPVRGIYMPDGIEAYEAGGETYLVTANEGDAREWGDYVEASRVNALGRNGLKPVCADAPAAGLLGNAELGRLNVSIEEGLNAAGTCYEELHAFGSRSFSIWSTDGEQVFDSGDAFEQITAQAIPEFFNSNHSASNLEGRSDDKGPEPENLAIGQVGPRTYAFIGFERVGGVVVFDITDPAESSYVTYLNRRDFSVSMEDAADPQAVLDQAGDLGPEGIEFVAAADSPTGEPMVIVGSEVSGTTTLIGVDQLDDEPTRVKVVGSARSRYGVPQRAEVRVSYAADELDAAPAGRVEVRSFGRVLATAPVVDGVARPALPATLPVGRRTLSYVFVPADAGTAGAHVSRPTAVLKARTATGVRVLRAPTTRASGLLEVRVRSLDAAGSSALPVDRGQVRVRIGSRTLTGVVRDGVAQVRVAPIARRGAHAVRAGFEGTASHGRSSARAITLRVR